MSAALGYSLIMASSLYFVVLFYAIVVSKAFPPPPNSSYKVSINSLSQHDYELAIRNDFF